MSEINRGGLFNASGGAVAPARRALGMTAVPAAKSARKNSNPADALSSDSPTLVQAEKAPFLHLAIVLTYFLIAFGCQLILLLPQFSPFRVELRVMPFGLSILLALFPPGRRSAGFRLHPALSLAVLILAIISVGMFNQYTQNQIAGLAQIALTAAILSPIFWVGRLQLGTRGLATIILCLWGFNALSASFGVLQVVFPGHFQPATSSVVQEFKDAGVELNIQLADGTEMARPYGLTDQPGGAATAGLIAFVFGLGLLVTSNKILFRGVVLAGMGVGLFVMYLSQVRASIVMCGVATVSFAGILSMRGEFARLTGVLIALAVVVFLSTSAAFIIGGDSTRDRLFTLVDEDAGAVYQSNRGMFLNYTFAYVLPNYPLGAGLGRYGMMSHYFNARGDADSLWAEIQWTAWAYDGGWLMVAVYPTAIMVALWMTFKIGKNPVYSTVGIWAAVLTCYNISVVAVIFSYPFFISQSGLEFWLLNAACFSAAQVYLQSLKPDVPVGFEVIPAPWRPKLPASTDTPNAPIGTTPRRPLPAVVPIFEESKGTQGNA